MARAILGHGRLEPPNTVALPVFDHWRFLNLCGSGIYVHRKSVGPLLWLDLPRQRTPQLLVGSRAGLSYWDFFHRIFPLSSHVNNTIIKGKRAK